MTTRNIKKSLVSMEDVAQGVGEVNQTRAGFVTTVHKIDVPFAVNSEAEMSALDITKYTRARVYSSNDTFLNYVYDTDAEVGVPSDTGTGSWVLAIDNYDILDLSQSYVFADVAEVLSKKILFPIGKVIYIKSRPGGSFTYNAGGTPNALDIIDAGNGNTLVATLTTPIIDTHIGISQGSSDSSTALLRAQELAKFYNTKVNLTIKGTYRTSKDIDLTSFTGPGWITLEGWTKNNFVEREVVNDKRPLMVEDAHTSHVGGQGNYTAFFGGIMFQGTKVFIARNGDGHISYPTRLAKYIVAEDNAITKGVLLSSTGSEMVFHDFRDPNLSVQRSLSQGPILSGSELTATPLVYKHYFMKLGVGTFNEETQYDVGAFAGDEFMWGNAVQSPNENWLKCTYGVTGAKLNNVYLYRATTNGSDPVAWTKIQDPLFEDASECTLCYYRDKLVAITRSEPQTNGLQLRWTYDLEGLSGWSEAVYLPFTGAAPAVLQYIPEGEPLFLHFSEPDDSTGYRMPSFVATYDLVNWTRQSTGQFKNNTGSGAYGGLVPDGKGSYSTMYYEEVGATEGVTRVWYGSMDLEGRVYPNDSTVRFMHSTDETLQKSTLLPNGESCLGSPGDITSLLTSNSNEGYFEVIPKTALTISAVVAMMADNTATNVSFSVTEDGVPVSTSATVSVEAVRAKLFEFPIALTMQVGKVYRFTASGSVQWYGRKRPAYYGSPYRNIQDDYTYYVYTNTNVEGLSFNTFALSHGFKL